MHAEFFDVSTKDGMYKLIVSAAHPTLGIFIRKATLNYEN